MIPVQQCIDMQEEKEAEEEFIGDDSGQDELEDTSDNISGEALNASPSLDPKRKPSSIGITFFVETTDSNITVCITWGEYEEIKENGESHYKRYPRSKVIEIPMEGNKKIAISEHKKIYFYYFINTAKNGENKKKLSLFIVNEIEPENKYKTEIKNVIFQPQIRIKFKRNTKLAINESRTSLDSEDSELALLYHHRDFSVKGHLCSIILKEFDPQISDNAFKKQFSAEALESPAFKWVDGLISNNLTKEEVEEFSSPDLRTEFVPMYSVPSPTFDIKTLNGTSIEFYAKELSLLWNPDELQLKLSPILDLFEKWIEGNAKSILTRPEQEQIILSKVLLDSVSSLQRMKKGFNLLLKNEEARLAFCLANRAMDLQYSWKRTKGGLKWRPFQIAYFLLTIESIYNSNSSDRSTCDLLWVATGGGKTEAYLAVIAFTIVLRRLRGIRESSDEGFGTSVITRYTLRLLAIQQFRRTLSLITALEYLRVSQQGENQHGWRPPGYNLKGDFILGTTPFTIGLWVGSGVTPNKLEGNDYTAEGAISKLKKPSDPADQSEPAQITSCPACDSILSIPSEGLKEGLHVLYLVVKADKGKLLNIDSKLLGGYGKIFLKEIEIKVSSNINYSTLKLVFEAKNKLNTKEINHSLEELFSGLRKYDGCLTNASSHPTKPGYFLRSYINQSKRKHEYNFDIYCPNPECPLTIVWFGASPGGMIDNKSVEEFIGNKGLTLRGNLKLNEIVEPFQMINSHYSSRIQIPAMTVDEQIYMNPPTVLLSTVDKFARPAFEPRVSAIFGNFDYYHPIFGYYRESLHGRGDNIHPSPSGHKSALIVKVKNAAPPDLILQDELHLVEGPLGGMVGMYETAVDYLIREKTGIIPKYIASTATIRNSEDQVQAIFDRKVHLFPPFGNNSDDRFFIHESEKHPLEEKSSGRLYLGIAAPGRGPLTPIYRILARLLQSGWKNRDDPEIDRFWTVTGYFNSIRELAGAVALYRQDIPQQVRILCHEDSRELSEERILELSSRTPSTILPTILETLNKNYGLEGKDSIDALFTTSMFGTGIDIPRLGLMVVNGQPKTTSSYIQSTGRIGRSSGGLVVTFLRASRPRDLSHYEYFAGFHRQLHRFVEPVSVYPFAPKVIERTLGPISVFLLRNALISDIPWQLDNYAGKMSQYRGSSSLVKKLGNIFETRAQTQPNRKRPLAGDVKNKTSEKIDLWEQENIRSKDMGRAVRYTEYFTITSDVILGDAMHRRSREFTTVYDDAPQSLRDIEETTSFET